MKTKYDSVLKVKKQHLDNAENELNKAKQRQIKHQQAYELADKESKSLSLPDSGNVQALKTRLSMMDIAREVRQRAKEKVELSAKEINHYQFLYKKAYLDYEKIKYLKEEEVKKQIKQIKQKEEKFIDELAVSRYFYGEKDV